jgi:hypothetical protein
VSICVSQNSKESSWLRDIDFYHKTLEEKHIDLYHTISKREFTVALEKIKKNVSNLTDFQIIIALMKLTQQIGGGKGDGHTSVPLWNRDLHKFPIKLMEFNGVYRVVKTPKKYAHLLGNTLMKINGIAINDIVRKIKPLTPFTENEQSSKDRVCSYIMIADILEAEKIITTNDASKFTFTDANEKEKKVYLKSLQKQQLKLLEYSELGFSNRTIIKPRETKHKDLWFTSFNQQKSVYIKFKEYISEKEMNEFSENVYDFIQQNKSKHLIIDLRDNYGGDFFIGQILASWLNASDSISWKSRVYVLVNRVTYSAAMVNALQFKQLLNAKVVGEPTGANPNGYQDLGQFKLPNSNLLITYTKRLFRLQDIDTKGLQPDMLITPKWDNYKKGVDEVLDWVLNDIKN